MTLGINFFFGLANKNIVKQQNRNDHEDIINFCYDKIVPDKKRFKSNKLRKYPKFSIVICTYNRINTLKETLESLKYLEYEGDFEVVVVNGPSNDGTDKYLSKFRNEIKVGYCPSVNISQSRNIGIAISKGDIIVFIDDDSIPGSDWLTDISKCYTSGDVACVGGKVYKSNGYDFESEFVYSDRFGDSIYKTHPLNFEYFPGSFYFPRPVGTNCSFRRDLLISVGGFDEEIEYYCDENDVIVRLVDANYKIIQSEGAFVYHKRYKSHIRNSEKMINYYPVVKNKLHHSLCLVGKTNSFIAVIHNTLDFINGIYSNIENAFSLSKEELDLQVSNAMERALKLYFSNEPKKLISSSLLQRYKNIKFKKFFTKIKNRPLHIVFICKNFLKLSGNNGSDLIKYFSRGIAKKGNIVHVICENFNSHSGKILFKKGIWVHCLKILNCNDLNKKHTKINDWSNAAYKECENIDLNHRIDAVEGTQLGADTIDFVNKKWPLITLLSFPRSKIKEKRKIIRLEKRLIMDSDAVCVYSNDIERALNKYNFLPKDKTKIYDSKSRISKIDSNINTIKELIIK